MPADFTPITFTEGENGNPQPTTEGTPLESTLWKGKKATMIRKVALVHALREAFPSTFGSLCDESEVHVDAESTAVELDDAGQAPAPRWARIKEAAEQADALTVEEAECSVDDPFAGGDRS